MKRETRINNAQMRLLFLVPFFAPGVMKLPVVWDNGQKYACTDGKKIKWNTEHFDSCKDEELVTVMCEEVGHNMLGHLWRAPVGADWKTWNRACDQVVRNMMAEFSEKVMAKGLADPFPFPNKETHSPDPKYRGMSEEEVYASMIRDQQQQGGQQPQQQPPQPGAGKPQPGAGKPQPGAGKPGPQLPGKKSKPGQQPGQGKPQPGPAQPGQGQGLPQPGEPEEFAEFEQPAGADALEKEKLKTSWDGTMLAAVQAAKGRGDLPGFMKEFAEEFVSPKIGWWEVLRSLLREQCNDDWNWMKPSPYFDDSPFILPDLDAEKIGTIVFATDTSGSINLKLLSIFQTEKQNALDEMNPTKLVDIYCDTQIHKVAEYTPGETIDRDCPGRGGTSFIPVFEHIEQSGEVPKVLVFFTDLDGTFPAEDPGYPVIWVVYGDKRHVPFGEVIVADTE
jgi:predicted metal-dependent peptidase